MSDHRLIQRRNVYALLAERLSEDIADGLQAGDPLPSERALMQQYGVGRSSVREALRMLESSHLIESRSSGTFVVARWSNPLNHSLEMLLTSREADLMQLFEVRWILEGEAAALAAVRRADEHLATLTSTLDEMAAGLESEARYIAADMRFHLTIADATGNTVVMHLMEAIRDQLRTALGSAYHIPGSAERSLAQHREIAGAIALRRPEDARALMHAHIRRVESEFEASLPTAP